MDEVNRIVNVFKKFKGLTTIGITNIASNAISGLFWLYIASLLDTTKYGQISYLIAIAGISTTISFLGSGNALIVYTAKKIKIESSIYSIALLAAVISAVILVLPSTS